MRDDAISVPTSISRDQTQLFSWWFFIFSEISFYFSWDFFTLDYIYWGCGVVHALGNERLQLRHAPKPAFDISILADERDDKAKKKKKKKREKKREKEKGEGGKRVKRDSERGAAHEDDTLHLHGFWPRAPPAPVS